MPEQGDGAMLKGVNKRVVEVVDIESEYFEKAILFLRAGRPDTDAVSYTHLTLPTICSV